MTKVYFAGPLFNKAEKDYNLKVVSVLEKAGYKVFLPQRDGVEGCLLKDISAKEKIDIIFNKDVYEVKNADVLFMVLDGRIPDEGACVELGIAYANGKRCYGFKTDSRVCESDLDINPMLTGCFNKIFKSFDGDALILELEEYLKENTL